MDFKITKPVSLWNREVNFDFKELFKALTKVVGHGFTQKWDDLAGDFGEVVSSLGLDRKPQELAWLLIVRSIGRALDELTREYFNSRGMSAPDTIDEIVDQVDLSVENMEITLTPEFFDRPGDSPVPGLIEAPFAQWLELCGLSPAEAHAIACRLRSYFIFALNEEWQRRAGEYETVWHAVIGGPFDGPVRQELAWRRYNAFLARQVEEPVFDAVFGLDKVYVPLRGWHKEEREEPPKFPGVAPFGNKKAVRVVVDTHAALNAWVASNDRQDCIRIVSGGPGSGKSSLAKMFAREQAQADQRVLFVPLHRFPVAEDMAVALSRFAKSDAPLLPLDPFDMQRGEPKLLLIFDGLDELASQGSAGHQAARDLVDQVQQAVDRWNSSGRLIKALITGREIVVSDLEAKFRRRRQVLHILPYALIDPKEYEDPQGMLPVDQRDLWWRRYGEAVGEAYHGMPQQLRRVELDEVTAQPLLNYLMAIALAGGVHITPQTNINSVYEHLVEGVFKRPWAERQHPALVPFADETAAFLILQEIAVAVWHGNGRAATKQEIQSRCKSRTLERMLDNLEIAAAEGVTRLLTAFYFRRAGDIGRDEAAYEFSHKSFGEYLAARHIIHQVDVTAKELVRNKERVYSGWSEPDSLKHWIGLCGPKAMDRDLFRFIRREITLVHETTAGAEGVPIWQSVMDGLLSWELRHGMPMQGVEGPATFLEQVFWARNSEEALLACSHAAAEATGNYRSIDWPEATALGLVLNRLRGQREGSWNVLAGGVNVLTMECLGLLVAKGQCLDFADLYGANLNRSNLAGISAACACLMQANLKEANLLAANLARSNLSDADLERANLERANLIDADLRGANLEGANLERANLRGAKLRGANLGSAYLWGANLWGADLEGANLNLAYLESGDLEGRDRDGFYRGHWAP